MKQLAAVIILILSFIFLPWWLTYFLALVAVALAFEIVGFIFFMLISLAIVGALSMYLFIIFLMVLLVGRLVRARIFRI